MAQQDQRAAWLISVPGIGHYSAMLILAEIGDIARFPPQTALLLRRSGTIGSREW